jgi:hypothetical protein
MGAKVIKKTKKRKIKKQKNAVATVRFTFFIVTLQANLNDIL